MKTFLTTLLLLLSLLSLGAQAGIETYTFDTAEKEANYKQLVAELRCLVCQNQNLADSNAELAQDLRREVYEMVSKGDDVDAVTDFMVKRYGDFVLYDPPMAGYTLLLWVGPFVFMVAAMFGLVVFVRKRKADAVVSDDERKVARSFLDDD